MRRLAHELPPRAAEITTVVTDTCAPGTMLRPGEVLTAATTAPAQGPAGELFVGMNSREARGEYGHCWVGAQAGWTKVTLFITAEGRRIELGTVTVIVR